MDPFMFKKNFFHPITLFLNKKMLSPGKPSQNNWFRRPFPICGLPPRGLLLVLIFWGVFSAFGADILQNSDQDIKAVNGKVKLICDYEWNADNGEEKNQFFKFPRDICRDPQGAYYISDMGNSRIQVFDKNRLFLRTVGREGQGPGDFLKPANIRVKSGNEITVVETGNLRIQTVNLHGKHIRMLDTGGHVPSVCSLTPGDDILLYMPDNRQPCQWTLSLSDSGGKRKKELFHSPCNAFGGPSEMAIPLMNGKGQLFIGHLSSGVIQKLLPSGELISAFSFAPSFPVPEYHLKTENGLYHTVCEKPGTVPVMTHFAVDEKDRIWVLAHNRAPGKDDNVFFTGDDRFPKTFPANPDLYRLLVFDSRGKITASLVLPHYADYIVLDGDRLFLIDSMRNFKIYEYRYQI